MKIEDIDDYKILTQQLTRPLGSHRYYAIIEFLIIDSTRIDPELGETFGTNEDEAKAKMQSKLDDWINSQ